MKKSSLLIILSVRLYNFIFGRTASGTYSVSKNIIRVYNNNELDCLFHELFHMSSTVVDKERNLIFTGFSQFSKKKNYFIGKGITEGYTQLLTERCFGDTHKIRQTYIVQVKKKL